MLITETRGSPFWNPIPGHERIRCWMGVPMVFQGEIVGIVCVDWIAHGPSTTRISRWCRRSPIRRHRLANARLYAAAQHRAEEIERVKTSTAIC